MRHSLRSALFVPLLCLSVTAAGAQTAPAVTGITSQKKFTMEFREANLKDVLRLLAQESGTNILVGEDVTGSITMSLRQVTLKEALEAILKSYDFSYSIVGNIATVSSKPPEKVLVTRTIPIHYANDVGDSSDLTALSESLKGMLSTEPGAGIAVLKRTNTLIVTDTPKRVEKIIALAKKLDQRTPQVRIEARIVEVKDINQRELGVQWGGKYTADSAHGNALSYDFPNSLSVGGTQGGDSNFLVNLPASAGTSGVGIAIGNIANTISLDLQLSAMENLQKLRILSSPSVLAVQNREAIIKVGEQLPFENRSTSSTGVTTSDVEFKDVVLQLKVVPYVVPDGRIFLTITINKDTRGEQITLTDGTSEFTIDTKEVTTRVLLDNGETAVIGGLHSQVKNDGESRVPGFSRIPLLGWLFRSKSKDSSSNELLVFLTPSIQD